MILSYFSFLSIFLCQILSTSSVIKIRCTNLDAVFAKLLLTALVRTVLICDLGSKVKVTVTQYLFFLHILCKLQLLYISALLCLIKLKLGMPLTYAFCRFVCEFHLIQMDKVTSFKFSIYKCPCFKFYLTYRLYFWYKLSTT